MLVPITKLRQAIEDNLKIMRTSKIKIHILVVFVQYSCGVPKLYIFFRRACFPIFGFVFEGFVINGVGNKTNKKQAEAELCQAQS